MKLQQTISELSIGLLGIKAAEFYAVRSGLELMTDRQRQHQMRRARSSARASHDLGQMQMILRNNRARKRLNSAIRFPGEGTSLVSARHRTIPSEALPRRDHVSSPSPRVAPPSPDKLPVLRAPASLYRRRSHVENGPRTNPRSNTSVGS